MEPALSAESAAWILVELSQRGKRYLQETESEQEDELQNGTEELDTWSTRTANQYNWLGENCQKSTNLDRKVLWVLSWQPYLKHTVITCTARVQFLLELTPKNANVCINFIYLYIRYFEVKS